MLERLDIPPDADGLVWFYQPRGRNFSSHHHTELELNIVVRGTATYILADRRYELGIGSAVWLLAGQEHVISREAADLQMWIAVFRPRAVREITAGASSVLRRRNPRDPLCRALRAADISRLDQLARSVERDRESLSTFNAGLRYLLAASWNAFSKATSIPDASQIHPAVRAAALQLASENPAPAIDILADNVALSPARLSRLFHSQMGLKLSDYRNRIRLKRFFEFYGNGDRLTALDAALRAGFGSYAQFHRIFRAHCGQSPRQYFATRTLASVAL